MVISGLKIVLLWLILFHGLEVCFALFFMAQPFSLRCMYNLSLFGVKLLYSFLDQSAILGYASIVYYGVLCRRPLLPRSKAKCSHPVLCCLIMIGSQVIVITVGVCVGLIGHVIRILAIVRIDFMRCNLLLVVHRLLVEATFHIVFKELGDLIMFSLNMESTGLSSLINV